MSRVSPGIVLGLVIGALALPVGLLVLAWNGWLPADARHEPPSWEQAIGHRALHASLAARAKELRNPVQVEDEAALLAGMNLFRNNCAGCHGGAHADSLWGAHNFYPRVPQFWRKQHEHMLTPEEAYLAIRDGVRYSGMGAWNGMLKEEQMWQVANFVSRMHHLPPRTERAWNATK